MAQKKKKPARERGYLPIEELAVGLRSLAAQLEQDNKGRLAKVSLNIWYEEDDEIAASVGAMTGGSSDG